jgi:hypothetical protein
MIGETAQIIQLFAVRPKLGKKNGTRSSPIPAPNAKKAYPTPAEISAFGATAATPGWKPTR